MARTNGKSTNGKKREYVRLAGFYTKRNKDGVKYFISNNIGKRLDESKYSGDNKIQLSIAENTFKKRDHSWDELPSNEPDAHLLIDRQNVDDLIKYLEIVRDDFDARK